MSPEIETAVDMVIRDALKLAETPPQERKEQPKPRWTLKRLVKWVYETFGIRCSRETLRKTLKQLGFSWKKARKLLNKANTDKRKEYLARLEGLLDESIQHGHLLIYIDEAHIHLDTDEGYGWSIQGERFWVSSCSPGKEKVSFYGVYLYNLGQVRIFPYDKGDGVNTIDVLEKLRQEFPDIAMNLVWDGAPYHRSQVVKDAAKELNINLEPLSAYSPDFMPVEHLWQWLREDVTYHTCYDKKSTLIEQVSQFQQQINQIPNDLADRLWVKNHLNPEEEKLRVSS